MNELKIEDMGFRGRTENAFLYRNECQEPILTVENLLSQSDSSLLRRKGFGKKCLEDVDRVLAKYGLQRFCKRRIVGQDLTDQDSVLFDDGQALTASQLSTLVAILGRWSTAVVTIMPGNKIVIARSTNHARLTQIKPTQFVEVLRHDDV